MRYAKIDRFDVNNGEGVGISLFVTGCHLRCSGCFNAELRDFSSGQEWTKETEEELFLLLENQHISRVSILGGDPLAKPNYLTIQVLMRDIKNKYPDKQIWLFTGLTMEEINMSQELQSTIAYCDILVDGRFEKDKRDLTLKFRGSSNQRIWRNNGTEWIIEEDSNEQVSN